MGVSGAIHLSPADPCFLTLEKLLPANDATNLQPADTKFNFDSKRLARVTVRFARVTYLGFSSAHESTVPPHAPFLACVPFDAPN